MLQLVLALLATLMPLAPFQQDHHTTETYGTDADVDDTIDLPGAHPISKIIIRHTATDSTANAGTTVDNVDIDIAGQSLLGGLDGAQLRALTKFYVGYTPSAPSAGTTEVQELIIPFGRFPGDTQFMLPADLFNARLIYEASVTAADNTNEVQVHVEQILGRSPEGLVTRKVSVPDLVSSVSADQDWQLEANTGRRLSGFYLDYNDVDNVDGSRLEVSFNNGQETPFEARREELEEFALSTYNLRDDSLPSQVLPLPFDRQGNPANAVPTGKNAEVRDVRVEGTAAGSGTSGDINLLQEDYVQLGGK